MEAMRALKISILSTIFFRYNYKSNINGILSFYKNFKLLMYYIQRFFDFQTILNVLRRDLYILQNEILCNYMAIH